MDGRSLTFFVAIGLIALGGIWDAHRRTVLLRKWQALAERLGLKNESTALRSKFKLTGKYHGHPVEVFTLSKSIAVGGKPAQLSQKYIWASMEVRKQQAILLVAQESFSTWVASKFGYEEITTGDEVFDRRFWIQGEPALLLHTVFQDANLRQQLLQVENLNLRLRKGELIHEQSGADPNIERLETALEAMAALADRIEQTRVYADLDD